MYWIVVIFLLFSCNESEELFQKEKQALILYKQGVQAVEDKDYQKAIVLFQESLEQDPNSKTIRYHLIEVRFSLEDYQDIPWLLRYNQEHPSDLDAIKLLRIYYCKQKDDRCNKLEEIIFFREQQQ